MSDKPVPGDEPVTIKKYANRRLYNTAASSYVTLNNLAQMVKEGVDFVVYDAKSGDDITRSVLTQIIVEEEGKGGSLLPIGFLRQIIGYYGDSLGGVVPQYLELSMETFARNHEQMRDHISASMGKLSPLKQFEEMGQANMQLIQNAMEMFTPFAAGAPKNAGETNGADNDEDEDSRSSASAEAIDDLKKKLDAMQSQLDKLGKK